MSKPFRIGIAGLGTVGTGVIKILEEHHERIAHRAGRPIEVVSVSARSKDKDRGIDLGSYIWIDDSASLAESGSLDAVVELIGGEDGVAKSLVESALEKGISVVTANKALLAHHGYELASLAEKHDAVLMYEAAVAGGIPIIKSIREGFAGNEISAVYGILNGTCNYILSEMRETGRPFDEVLEEAQYHGYAETDPTFDIDGIDAGHKICLLSALAFGIKPDFKQLKMIGIKGISAEDISYAQELGYKIKLLGISKALGDKIVQMVEPCLVPEDSTMGAVEGVFNAVFVEGDHVDTCLEVGRGAGEGPTASAVVADIIDLARGYKVPAFGVPVSTLSSARWADPGDIASRFYIHLIVLDKPGVLADISAIMRDHEVSMEAVMQHSHDPNKPVSIVITSHDVKQDAVNKAIAAITQLSAVMAEPTVMRIENFGA